MKNHWIEGLIFVAIMALIMACCFGCASVFERDGQGNIIRQIDSRGVLRNANYSKTIHPDGTETISLSTESTTSDLLLGLDKLTGTLIDGAGKVSGAVK
jgi:hypothetical protein